MSDLFHDAGIRERFIVASGRVIREWAALEAIIAQSLECLVGCDQFRARALWLCLPNFNARRKLVASLVSTYVAEEDAKKFRSLLKRASKLAGKRNLIAHARFVVDEGQAIHFTCDNNSGDELEINFAARESYTIKNIEGWPQAIIDLWGDWLALSASLTPINISTSPRTHPASPKA